MNNIKKIIIIGSIVAIVTLVGGTTAYFMSVGYIVNPFEITNDINGGNQSSGIVVEEDFKPAPENQNPIRQGELEGYDDNSGSDGYGGMNFGSGPKSVIPGEIFTKKVRATSKVTFNQYLRGQVEIMWDQNFINLIIENGSHLNDINGNPYHTIVMSHVEAIAYANTFLEIEYNNAVGSHWYGNFQTVSNRYVTSQERQKVGLRSNYIYNKATLLLNKSSE
ncbi:MAG: hypothetical protein ACRCZG_02280, partial [Culicoidibacterales bacterium]